jgi:hypothetical protein
MINNLYTVDVSVSLDGENTGKIHQFYGIGNYDKGSATTTSTTWEEQVTSTVEINPATTNGPELTGGDNFGTSIVNIGDLNGDGVDDMAVGAGNDDEGGANRGAVHIMYMNTDGSVSSTVEINDSTTNGPELEDNDWFGYSIANIGDLDGNGYDDLAVGAYGDDDSGGARGAVHILFMDENPGNGLAKATEEINDSTTNGPELANSDFFGRSVANIGDLDGNGVNDLAVGAYGDNNSGSDRGVVHILFMDEDPGNGLAKATEEINNSTTNGPELDTTDWFGMSVANIGDLDGNGINDLAVGAMKDDDGETDRGAVHILFMDEDPGNGLAKATVEINNSTTNGPELEDGDFFGRSVANMGDLDGDGVNDLAVGADRGNDSGANRGEVHVFFMNAGGTVKSTVEINDSTTNGPSMRNQDFFGISVANIGDLDGNGINDLAVGANGDDGGEGIGNNSGAVHILFLE